MRILQAILAGGTALGFALVPRPAAAQADTETDSYGESYESVTINEYGEGSVSYNGYAFAEINGEQVGLPVSIPSRYENAYSVDEVAALLPGSYIHNVGGVDVTITGWSGPERTETWEEIVGYYFYDSYTYDVLDESSVQFTSGDGPDAVVPIGFRGYCSDAGVSGETNFGAFDGAFANCESAEDYVTVAPGTINLHTHTTTIYRDTYSTFEIYDYLYTDTFLVRPTASASWSSGTMTEASDIARTLRTDSYRTGFIGMLGGTMLFDETAEGQLDGTAAQALLADLSAPMAYHVGGAPVIVTWSDPVLAASSETLLSSNTEMSVTTEATSVITVTTTLGLGGGEFVLIGDRGACTTSGTADTLAQCEGGVTYTLATGETNTNTHTTLVTENTTVTTTTENWLTAQTYRLEGTATAIGQIHGAITDALYDDSREFAALQAAMLRERGGLGFGLWINGFTGGAERDNRDGAPGWTRDREGLAGGLSFALSGIASLGVSASHSTSDIAMAGIADGAEISQTQLAIGAQLSPGIWQVQLALGKGWSEIDTRRGGAPGAVSTASYDGDTLFAAGRAGPELAFGPISLRPYAGFDWARATLDSFGESGGFALTAPTDRQSRLELRLGTELEAEVGIPGGWGLRFEADIAGGSSTGDDARTRQVAFTADPANMLTVTAARAPGVFGEGRVGATLRAPMGLRIHLGAGGRLAKGNDSWQASAGLSLAF